MINTKDSTSFIRNFLVSSDIDFFLGSGASLLAGIPSGQNLVWQFKKEIYCSENNVSRELFKDLQSERNRTKLQDYFDSLDGFPKRGSKEEYSFYFEKCYDNTSARNAYIQKLVANVEPIRGHLCLANLFINNQVKNIWTTNFDELIEAGIKTLSPQYSFNVVSSIQKESISQIANNNFQNVIKLHGDYRYDSLQNTEQELQNLESQLSDLFCKNLMNKGLIVIGYAGNDDSVMKVLEDNIDNKDFLSKGIYWCKPQNTILSEQANAFMEKACKNNELSCVIDIDGFDEFLNLIYQNYEHKNLIIDERWKDFDNRKKEINFSSDKIAQSSLKMNTFVSTELPSCNVFETDIKNWKELRTIIGGNNDIIAGLFNGKVYSFSNSDKLKEIFKGHIKSEVTTVFPETDLLNKENFVYLGLLYELIKISLLQKTNIKIFGRNKYYFSDSGTEYQNKFHYTYKKYSAFEIQLSYINDKIYLSIIPTIYLTNKNGSEVSKLYKQAEINCIISNIHNSNYGNILKDLNTFLYEKGSNEIIFTNGDFSIKFNFVCFSYKLSVKPEHPQVSSFKFDEPEMLFDVNDINHTSINQLKGLQRYAPIDYSFETAEKSPIRIAILSPNQQIDNIIGHLNSLNAKNSAKSGEMFLPNYEGFYETYKRALNIPDKNNTQLCRMYDEAATSKANTASFVDSIKSQIDYFQTQLSDFDVLVIYIPKSFAKFREDSGYDPDFNLHDAIKLYGTNKGIKIQFIEERSLTAYDKCKVMWALSTSLYAKASGVLWHPVVLDDETAFVGISYAKSNTKGICIGCSQLFDSTGTGIRLILKKLDDPQYIGKNPYMKRDEARTTISKLREEYYKCDPVAKLRRIVIHKTTPFTPQEIAGFTEALEGIEDIELLQIQGYSPYRAIKYFIKEGKAIPNSFPLERGTTIKLSNDSFLLWTHGCVVGDDIGNCRYNTYYKGGRGIPLPVLVKRFYGKASGDTLVKEILMLTKMNWNSGDNLYKNMPVTLDFAKTLSRMSKQKEALYNKSYDFRYFM